VEMTRRRRRNKLFYIVDMWKKKPEYRKLQARQAGAYEV
jgi:hypothetical protein